MKNLLYLLPLFLISCNSPGLPENFDYGATENGQYQNDYFGFSIDVPEEWHIPEQEVIDQLTESGTDLIAGENEDLKKIMKASEINSATLLTVFQEEIGTVMEFNPSYMIVVENIRAFPAIQTAEDYQIATRENLEKAAGVDYQFPTATKETRTIGGKEIRIMDTFMEYAGSEIHQVYYTWIDNGFALNCIISYTSADQKLALEEVLQSLKFKG
ncbi:MAG: hypothetical protein GYB31_16065 [Bacteroidetes bacterium]|nr:hypothetical protein [Bacteroidota bacterium]